MDAKPRPSVTGKQRATRIFHGYHHRRDELSRKKTALTLIAVVLTLAVWLGWGLMATEQKNAPFSHGPVASVHATWENKCEACHVDFAPIQDGTWAASLLNAWSPLPNKPGKWEHLADQKCEACHPGPVHHFRQIPDEVPSCASCHQEHDGRLASLLRMDDATCTKCHDDLNAHLVVANPQAYGNVTRFDLVHPTFRSLEKKDPGTIRFTHGHHLAAGLKFSPDDKKVSMTVAELSQEDRVRLRVDKQSETDLVQLDCASCHQPDPTGQYMRPVTFEENCRACHALEFEPGTNAKKVVPHGLSPVAVREFLRSAYLREYVEQNPGVMEKKIARHPVMGNVPEPESEKAKVWVDKKASEAEKHLTTVCGHCHQKPEPGSEPVLKPVLPAEIPKKWLQHARFDHAAHRKWDCRKCHEQAYPAKDSGESKDARDGVAIDTHDVVMIVNRDKCIECHSPLSSDGKRGGARFDCVECHRYHGADHVQARAKPKPEAKP
ncbi:MAG: cytochrome c3 family protein [Planctomycetaceae bacterium]